MGEDCPPTEGLREFHHRRSGITGETIPIYSRVPRPKFRGVTEDLPRGPVVFRPNDGATQSMRCLSIVSTSSTSDAASSKHDALVDLGVGLGPVPAVITDTVPFDSTTPVFAFTPLAPVVGVARIEVEFYTLLWSAFSSVGAQVPRTPVAPWDDDRAPPVANGKVV